MKQIFGIFTALAAAGLIVVMAQMIREGLYPWPPTMDLSNKKLVAEWMTQLPKSAFYIIAISHSVAAFSAGLISSLVAGSHRVKTGIFTICVLLVIILMYLLNYHFPLWFKVTDVISVCILGSLGITIGSARYVK
ncbi:MAG: hypothetical protein LC107_07680 [Chitinophagales bacterium]|nr:hypothetical protein [Chitinophagales bacterium]